MHLNFFSSQISHRLSSMKETQRRHALERDNLLIELDDMTKDTEKITLDGPERSNRFQFYQNLRGYVTDLVECFDEKVGSIFNLLNSGGQRNKFCFAGHLESLSQYLSTVDIVERCNLILRCLRHRTGARCFYFVCCLILTTFFFSSFPGITQLPHTISQSPTHTFPLCFGRSCH